MTSVRIWRVLARIGLVLLATGFFAQTASAANVMFQAERLCLNCMIQPYWGAVQTNTWAYGYPNPNGPSAIATVKPSGGFEVASKAWENAWGVPFSFSATFPGYPYFKAIATQYWGPIEATLGRHTATFTINMSDYDSTYPYAPNTTDKGFVKLFPGPKNLGGEVKTVRTTWYTGTVSAAGGGFSDFTADVKVNNIDASQLTMVNFSTRVNRTFTDVYNVVVARAVRPMDITGRIEASVPGPPFTRAFTETGYDNRNSANTTGTIQLVGASMASNFILAGNVAPRDGSGVVTSRVGGGVASSSFTMTLLPEPGQLALLAAGVVGLGLIVRRRR
jgi:hypothetical protein